VKNIRKQERVSVINTSVWFALGIHVCSVLP